MEETKLYQLGELAQGLALEPTWTENDEIVWRAEWDAAIKGALDRLDAYPEDSKEVKEAIQRMLDKKTDNKLWMFQETKRLERLNTQLSNTLSKLLSELERVQQDLETSNEKS